MRLIDEPVTSTRVMLSSVGCVWAWAGLVRASTARVMALRASRGLVVVVVMFSLLFFYNGTSVVVLDPGEAGRGWPCMGRGRRMHGGLRFALKSSGRRTLLRCAPGADWRALPANPPYVVTWSG